MNIFIPSSQAKIYFLGWDLKTQVPVICMHAALMGFRGKSTSCSRPEYNWKLLTLFDINITITVHAL